MKNVIRFSAVILLILIIHSCKKNEVSNTVTDIDGNVYKTVTIGTQVWMGENLKTTRYNNGDLIGTTNPATLDISSEATPKYQWAYEGNESYVNPYGRLFTWYTIADSRNVCPTGWHVPTSAELASLIAYLGGESVAGGKLKETSTTHWASPNTGATNESGFTALPGGFRSNLCIFIMNGYYGGWWSITEYNLLSAWGCGVENYTKSIGLGYGSSKYYGHSVRCLKD